MSHTADVVIIGAGVTGASIAFNLAQRGISNVVVLEKNFHCLRGNRQKLGLYSPTLFDRGHRAHGPAQPGRF